MLIKEKSNKTSITRYYRIQEVDSNLTALKWINSIKNLQCLDVNYIYYTDLLNRSDEGSQNIQFDSDVNIDTMKQELQKRDIDLIILNGRFYNKPFVIGVDLRSSLIYLTIRKSNQVNIELIEQKLKILNKRKKKLLIWN